MILFNCGRVPLHRTVPFDIGLIRLILDGVVHFQMVLTICHCICHYEQLICNFCVWFWAFYVTGNFIIMSEGRLENQISRIVD